MTWLARLEIDHRIAMMARLFDNYAWHQRLWDLFPGQPDKKRDFLTRVDLCSFGYRVYVLSRNQPLRPEWCAPIGWAIKKIENDFLDHARYRFDVRANPTKCISKPDSEGRLSRHGKRIALLNEEEQRAWLSRKGNDGGFSILEEPTVQIERTVPHYFEKKVSGRIIKGVHSGVQFRGVLTVTNRTKFIDTFHFGIGSGKAFGFGMLMLQPLN